MKVAAVSTDRRHDWTTAFRRSSFGRAIIRRLPSRVKRWLRAGRLRQRRVVAQMRIRWHRSLQLRVVSTTLVLSAIVIAVLGFFLVQSIAAGLLSSAESSAGNQVNEGRLTALGQPGVNVLQQPSAQPGTPGSAETIAQTTATALQQASANTGSYLVFIQLTNNRPAFVSWVARSSVNVSATIPQDLIAQVTREQRSQQLDNQNSAPATYEPTTLVYASGPGVSGPALAFGVPLGYYYQLYYVFPFTQQQATLLLVQRILVGVGLALVVLLAAIASLVTRWVVLPVRHAAQAAQRLSAGHLSERMRVRGVDDLAALATSFNEMATSLQGKLRELEELSHVQRRFVSDVSHELRTPLATIKMAAEVLFESRANLNLASGRSAELLQSQLERFESLLVDLLEISRYDAGAASRRVRPGAALGRRRTATGRAPGQPDRVQAARDRVLRRGGPAQGGTHPAQHPGERGRARRGQGRGRHHRHGQRRGRRLGQGLRRGAAAGRGAAGL